jgi:hypothetical protein
MNRSIPVECTAGKANFSLDTPPLLTTLLNLGELIVGNSASSVGDL